MTWTTLTYGVTNSAEDVNTNFQHIRSGNMIPFTQSAAGTLTAADNTYDLGSSTYRWKEIHIQNLDIASGGRVENTWNLIAEYTATDTITAISFTGLNGDTDEIYHIIARYNIQTIGGLGMFLNQDSGSSYGNQRIFSHSSTVLPARETSFSSIRLAISSLQTSTVLSNFNEMYIYAKTGYERLILHTGSNQNNGTYVYSNFIMGHIYSNKTTTITSMQFTNLEFCTNTTIQIWSPSMNITATGTGS